MFNNDFIWYFLFCISLFLKILNKTTKFKLIKQKEISV